MVFGCQNIVLGNFSMPKERLRGIRSQFELHIMLRKKENHLQV